MTRFARHERAQHAGFQINPFDLKSVSFAAQNPLAFRAALGYTVGNKRKRG